MLVPGVTPVTAPVVELMVKLEVLLAHVPPVTPALNPNVVVFNPHTVNDVVPEITGVALSATD